MDRMEFRIPYSGNQIWAIPKKCRFRKPKSIPSHPLVWKFSIVPLRIVRCKILCSHPDNRFDMKLESKMTDYF